MVTEENLYYEDLDSLNKSDYVKKTPIMRDLSFILGVNTEKFINQTNVFSLFSLFFCCIFLVFVVAIIYRKDIFQMIVNSFNRRRIENEVRIVLQI